MVLTGTIVNGVCIIVGSIIGLSFTKIPEHYKDTIMNGIGLAVILIGLQMAMQTENIVVVLLSLLSGAIIGEFLKLESMLNRVGGWLEQKMGTNHESTIAQGFITATLIFVIGAMSVIGALDSGLRGDHEVLITKSFLDGFMALVLTTSLGFGVILSVIPVVVYQGTIAILATQIEMLFPTSFFNDFITEMTASGGLMIVAIGFNLLKLTNIRVANLLPALITVAFILLGYQFLN
ncbi:DUF554 domain-containing protein [Aquibacillus sediminis]|uniref:DUF554 domain-containing protein n=1 Tax=Aquibacillus sediminis TaxID=2574734 RepID=UPI0011099224|nr:DUF554 domain-containing protein [Aquibacillus sediminis]